MATTAAQDRVNKPLAFSTSDVKGNVVICAASTFNSHIQKGHPEMVGRIADVESAIQSPDQICLSTSSPNALIHELVCSDSVQIRVVTTYDQIEAFEFGTTIAKVNSAFPVQPEEYDTPHVGAAIYKRPVPPPSEADQASNEEKGGKRDVQFR